MNSSWGRNVWQRRLFAVMLGVVVGFSFTACKKDTPQADSAAAANEASQSESAAQTSSVAQESSRSEMSSSSQPDSSAAESSSSEADAASQMEEISQASVMIMDDGTSAISVMTEVDHAETVRETPQGDAAVTSEPDRILPPPMLPVGWEQLHPEDAQRRAEMLTQQKAALKEAAAQESTSSELPEMIEAERILPPPMKPVGWEALYGNTPYTEDS